MTIEIELPQFRCPTCGHLLGEEEYRHACEVANTSINTKVQQIIEEKTEKFKDQNKQLADQVEKQQKIIERHEKDTDREVNKRVNESLKQKMASVEANHNQQLAEKNTEIEAAKLQTATDIQEKIELAVNASEERHKLKDKDLEIQLERIKNQNKQLADQVEKQQKIIDGKSSERRGTAGEFVLLDELKSAFPKDDFQPKKPFKEMADVIQTIVTETGEKILTPIVYDMKTGDNITPIDIEKAKRYKEIHNTDCSIIVTAKGIRPKDCESKHTTLIARREGILLLHPSVVVGIARLIRNFVIKNAKQTSINNGSELKYRKVYDYIMSLERFRKIEERTQIKSKLDELQTNEEEYHKRKWKERKEAIQDWFNTDEDDQHRIDGIT